MRQYPLPLLSAATLAAMVVLASSCGESALQAPVIDAGAVGLTVVEIWPPERGDAGWGDAGPTEGDATDGGEADAGVLDDAGPADSGPTTVGPIDAGFTDAGPTTWVSEAPPPAPVTPFDGAMSFDSARGVSVLFGGLVGCGFSNETWEWSGAAWTQRTVNGDTGGPPQRYAHAMAFDAVRGLTVVFGGLSSAGLMNDTWTWNGTVWAQSSETVSPSAREFPTMSYDSDRGVAVLFGGQDASGYRNDTWELNAAGWTLRTPATSPPALAGSSVASSGSPGSLVYDPVRHVTLLFTGSAMWTWDGTDWTQLTVSTLPPNGGVLAFDSSRGVAVLVGGFNGGDVWEWNGSWWSERFTADSSSEAGLMDFDSTRGVTVMLTSVGVWEWNGATLSQRTGDGSGLSPPSRAWHAMAFDSARNATVLFGGSSNGVLNDTWEHVGQRWAQAFPAVLPPSRALHAMAYDAARGVTVMFGGCGDSAVTCQHYLSDTWEWDGTSWTEAFPTAQPSAREQHAMVYDAARGVIVLFGGAADSGPMNDTWEWDGTQWTQAATTSAPAARVFHAMTYDATRQVTVLFGGVEGQELVNDTWTWNGQAWSRQAPVHSPSARIEATLAFDSDRQVSVLFGGSVADIGAVNETWAWTGTDWVLESPLASPGARTQQAMVYDSGRHVTLTYGGDDGFELLYDTWELHNG